MDCKTIRPIIVGAALFLGGCSFALDTLWPSLTGEDPAGADQPAQQAQAPAQAPSAPAPTPAPQATAQTPPQPGTTNVEAPGAAPGTGSGTSAGQKVAELRGDRALNTVAAPSRPPAAGGSIAGRRPLVVIRFDGENVAYEQALYNAVSRALERRPNATFELVAVAPASGGAARQALSSNRTLRGAENVLRSLQGMGLPAQRVEVSAQPSAQATTNEVHLYLN